MVSRITYMMIQSNDVEIVETTERCEAWMMKEGHPHALMLSCPLDKRKELEDVIKQIKDEAKPTEPKGSGLGDQIQKTIEGNTEDSSLRDSND